ncbi:MAG: hypothetical protein U0795_08075 [Pirellulales bacterium]
MNVNPYRPLDSELVLPSAKRRYSSLMVGAAVGAGLWVVYVIVHVGLILAGNKYNISVPQWTRAPIVPLAGFLNAWTPVLGSPSAGVALFLAVGATFYGFVGILMQLAWRLVKPSFSRYWLSN